MATYVLVHGGFAGGWQYKKLEAYLRQAGHTVYRPTLTGLGERVHLASPELDLDVQIDDILNVFQYEELDDVILLGYSYSGLVITGVAEKIPEKIKHLVYLDSYMPEDGQSLADILGEPLTQALQQAVDEYGEGWYLPHDGEHALGCNTPIKPAFFKLSINNPKAKALPRTFISLTAENSGDPVLAPIAAAAQSAKADPNWQYYEIAAEHGDAWDTHPKELSDILLKLA